MDILTLLLFFSSGFLSGFCSSAPLGPINLWLVEAVIKGSQAALRPFLAGVIFSDLVFAGVAVWGYYEFLKDSEYLIIGQILAAVFLLAIGGFGLYNLFKGSEKESHFEDSRLGTSRPRQFLFGMIMCGSNPGFLMFWLFVISFMSSSMDLVFSFQGNILFLLGVALGDVVWFSLLVKFVTRGLNLAKPSILLGIRYGIALAFLVCGVVALWRIV